MTGSPISCDSTWPFHGFSSVEIIYVSTAGAKPCRIGIDKEKKGVFRQDLCAKFDERVDHIFDLPYFAFRYRGHKTEDP